MAHGDPISSERHSANVYSQSWKLLDAAIATADGKWIDVRGFPRMTVDVFGTFVGTVQLHGSNEADKPADATDGRQLGGNITTASIVAVDSPVRWIKAKVSAFTSGTINANLNVVSM